ncbi:MAG: triose-phosphate isomerase [Candidatus Lokiarchaeota archaeon]|nr:triose-phosphate isomerase [Candidatus Lokiarchaeota archaeon]
MRKPIIGGNWKMNLGVPSEAVKMLNNLISLVRKIELVDVVIAPPFTVLESVIKVAKKSNIKIAAQNMYFKENGAFTGEISPNFLKKMGVEYVILGHSERRDIFYETDELINNKLIKALSMDIIPIVCIGEHLHQREEGKTKEIIAYQMENTFKNISKEDITKTIIAYEPIWAIGTGKTATPEQAEEIHSYIRSLLVSRFNEEVGNKVRIQYGGSVKPNNAEAIFSKDNIDGGLVGGASLEASSFYEIIRAAEKLK